jgi:hypothetical protein
LTFFLQRKLYNSSLATSQTFDPREECSKKFELCHEDSQNMVQPGISIKTPIIDNPFQHYETAAPN